MTLESRVDEVCARSILFGYSEWPTTPLVTRVFKVTAAFLLDCH
jgi:hypothetical protein